MVHVFLLHPTGAGVAAKRIAERLERGAEARVTLMETGGDSVAELWDAGLDADGIVLLLSPESVPQEKGRGPWESLLTHVERWATPPVSFVEMAPCSYPGILKRRDFQPWTAETPRALERWALSLHPALRPAAFVPAALPWFEAQRAELDRMWEDLVDRCGVVRLAGAEASHPAQAFAREARGHFREIVWIGCAGRQTPFILGELKWRLETDDVTRTLDAHRILVVLDDFHGDVPGLVSEGGRSSVLVTTCEPGSFPTDGRRRPEWAPLDAGSREAWLWDAVCVCRLDCFLLEFAAELGGVDAGAAAALVEQRYIEAVDEAGRWYRRCAPAAAKPEMARRRDELLREVFRGPYPDVTRCRQLLAEAETTKDLALGRRVFRFLRQELRYAEAALFSSRLLDEAWEQGDQAAADDFEEELRWLHEGAQVRRPWTPGEQIPLF